MSQKIQTSSRDGFSSQWGFILACIGSAVGMGNIWRFPVMVSTYGGLTFLIPYFIFVVLIAASGVMEEFALGRRSASGPIGAFGLCMQERFGKKKIGEIIGLLPVIGSLALAIGYTVVFGWIMKYVFLALSGGLHQLGSDMKMIGGTFGSSAPESSSLAESIQTVFSGAAGNNLWLAIGLLLSLIIMAMGIAGGIEKANKVMMPLLFVLFVGLAVYIATLPGAVHGYRYIFSFNAKGLSDITVWIFAFGQAFFSLSIAGNGSVIYGSYLGKKENLPGSALNVALFDTLAALLAAFVIIPAMAVNGAELSKGGPGLMFVHLVKVFNEMPGGRIVGIIFFICVFFAGLSSIVNLYEAPVAALHDRFGLNRKLSVALIGLLGGLVAVCIQGITSQWMDAVSIYICPFGAMLAGIMFFWILTKEKILDAVNLGAKREVGLWFVLLGRYIYVPLALIALVLGAMYGGIG